MNLWKALVLSLAALASACTINEMLEDVQPDLRQYPRILVLPFSDRDGLDRLYARDVSRGLLALGLTPVGAEAAEPFAALKPGPSGELSAQDLADVRAKTGADSVLSGEVDCGRAGKPARVSFVLQETAGGKVVLKDSFTPKRCGSHMDSQPIAAGVAAAFRRELDRRSPAVVP
jgi:hypothetical protein